MQKPTQVVGRRVVAFIIDAIIIAIIIGVLLLSKDDEGPVSP